MLQGFHRRGRDDDVFYVYTKSCSNVCTLWAPANQWRGNQAQVCRASGQHYKLSTCIAAHVQVPLYPTGMPPNASLNLLYRYLYEHDVGSTTSCASLRRILNT